jgi:hypothetical protein
LPALAVELVQHRVMVVVGMGGGNPALAAKAATSIIPMLFSFGDDPMKIGLVEDYKPGATTPFWRADIRGDQLYLFCVRSNDFKRPIHGRT